MQAVLPHLTAGFNALAVLFLTAGFVFIRLGRRSAHRKMMISALCASSAFLVVYLIYHFTAPIFVFPGTGLIRPIYYFVLISHVILSIVVLPMIVLTARRAIAGNFLRHRSIAVWTYPIWMYVSLSGLFVYGLLYHVYGSQGG